MRRIDLNDVGNKYRIKDNFRVMHGGREWIFDTNMITDERWRAFMFEMRRSLFYYGLEYINIKHL